MFKIKKKKKKREKTAEFSTRGRQEYNLIKSHRRIEKQMNTEICIETNYISQQLTTLKNV